MNRLFEILAEQSSPAEVLVFLAVAVAVFLGIALLVYVLIMAVLRLGLPERVPLRRVLLPSAERLRENLGDYVLATSTSILLALTLMVKHDLVQQIQNFDMGTVPPEEVALLFDFGLPPELAEEMRKATLSEVVKPLLAAGKVEESDLLVRNIVPLLERGWLTPRILIAACILLAAFYLVWLARRRYLALHHSPDSSPEYASMFRPLLTLALCVGLLLASSIPLAMSGEKFLARSALDAIQDEARLSGAEASAISHLISQELDKQRERAAFLYCADCRNPKESIWRTVEQISGVMSTPLPLTEQVDAITAACQSACDAEMADLETALVPLRTRLTGMETRSNDLQQQLAMATEQQIPQAERNLAEENARLTSRVDELERRLAILDQEVKKNGEVPSGSEELAQRVSRLESFYLPPSAAEQNSVCVDYARRAVQMNQRNIEAGCNLIGPRWLSDEKAHYQWCVQVAESTRQEEDTARRTELANCRGGKP